MGRLVLALCAVVLVVTAGCVGDELRIGADPAGVDDDTLSATGYQQTGSTTATVTQQATVDGRERTVVLETITRTYERDGARFVVSASPAVDLDGESANPLAQQSLRSLAAGALGVGTDALTPQGQQAVTVFGRSATALGYGSDSGRVSVLRVLHDGDVLVVVAVGVDYPQPLLSGLVHPDVQ